MSESLARLLRLAPSILGEALAQLRANGARAVADAARAGLGRVGGDPAALVRRRLPPRDRPRLQEDRRALRDGVGAVHQPGARRRATRAPDHARPRGPRAGARRRAVRARGDRGRDARRSPRALRSHAHDAGLGDDGGDRAESRSIASRAGAFSRPTTSARSRSVAVLGANSRAGVLRRRRPDRALDRARRPGLRRGRRARAQGRAVRDEQRPARRHRLRAALARASGSSAWATRSAT